MNPCLFCGATPVPQADGAPYSYWQCNTKRCWASGPNDDHDGAKWNLMMTPRQTTDDLKAWRGTPVFLLVVLTVFLTLTAMKGCLS